MYENKYRKIYEQILQTKKYYFMKDLTFKCAEQKFTFILLLLILRVGIFL